MLRKIVVCNISSILSSIPILKFHRTIDLVHQMVILLTMNVKNNHLKMNLVYSLVLLFD